MTQPEITEFSKQGYAVTPAILSGHDLEPILDYLHTVTTHSEVRPQVHAIRKLFCEHPQLVPIVFTNGLQRLIQEVMGDSYFLTKAIYFDKPEQSNWFVPYHQDITISVQRRIDTPGYKNWTKKQGYTSVQPPLAILENTVTLRLHLDQTNDTNGALYVVPESHRKGVFPSNMMSKDSEVCCEVEAGGVMLMKPLTFHASRRSLNGLRRRVIHLEFNNRQLPNDLQWAERLSLAELAS
ncbi:MAG: phytanoyl-CoA dioxygenase family protein [Bacteroidia bacterium]|nr:phytanoyl-CoA dioxygenase family protein [Bacteroidia bacterium]